jgi:RIP metalloprotease RseP
VAAGPSAIADVLEAIKSHANQPLTITVQRSGKTIDIPVKVAEAPDGQGIIGVQLATNAKVTRHKAGDPAAAVVLASKEFGRLASNVAGALQQLVFNFQRASKNVAGPVAIVAIGADMARSDPSSFFTFAATVNLNLAIVNSLPLPALDGGYLALLVAEALRGKKLEEKLEKTVVASGILFLFAVAVVMVVMDTVKLSGRALM